MRITKLGHCCLLIEEAGVRILTDPGAYSTLQATISDVDIVLITHEHSDHLHMESLKGVLERSSDAIIITNAGVGKLLTAERIPFTLLTDGMEATVRDIAFAAHGTEHAELFETFGLVENTGYLINGKLFYPGDAFTTPPTHAPILALPVAGPWMKLSEAIRYAIKMKPQHCFPVHDGMLVPARGRLVQTLPKTELAKHGIAFHPLGEGDVVEF